MRHYEDSAAFRRSLLSLVLPITIQQFMLNLVSVTDAVMLGFVDQTFLSAVSLAGQIQFVLSLSAGALATGAGILAAQYWGRHDKDTVERIIPIAMGSGGLIGLIFTLAALFCPRLLMLFFTSEEALIAAGAVYLRAVAPSYLLFSLSQICLCSLKNAGGAKVSSIINSTAVAINIVLNALLIFGLFGFPKLGIAGAAYATVIARLVELIWVVLYCRKPGCIHIRWGRLFRKDPVLAGDFWKYTTPVLWAGLVWGVGVTMYSVIMGHMGSDAVAANSIVTMIRNILFCLCRGISQGTGILIGNLLGSGDLTKAKDYAARLTKLAAVFGFATGGLLILVSPAIVALAPLSETARGYLYGMVLFTAANTAAKSVNTTVLDGIFCAGGDAKFDSIGNIFAMWCFAIPLGFLAAFVFKWPVLAVALIVNADEVVKIPAVFLHYRKYVWLKDLTRKIEDTATS